MFQWFTNLHSLSTISAGFREAIRGDDLLRYDEIRRKVVEANALVNRMSDRVMVHWQVMPSLVKMMALLSPAYRERLVAAAIARPEYTALSALGAGMACLSEPQRKRVIDAATDIGEAQWKSKALSGLGA